MRSAMTPLSSQTDRPSCAAGGVGAPRRNRNFLYLAEMTFRALPSPDKKASADANRRDRLLRHSANMAVLRDESGRSTFAVPGASGKEHRRGCSCYALPHYIGY